MSAGAFAAQEYTPYFVHDVVASRYRPVSYDPQSRKLVVQNPSGQEEAIHGVLHAQVKTWCKMPRPDAYFESRIKNDERIKALNARLSKKAKGSEA